MSSSRKPPPAVGSYDSNNNDRSVATDNLEPPSLTRYGSSGRETQNFDSIYDSYSYLSSPTTTTTTGPNHSEKRQDSYSSNVTSTTTTNSAVLPPGAMPAIPPQPARSMSTSTTTSSSIPMTPVSMSMPGTGGANEQFPAPVPLAVVREEGDHRGGVVGLGAGAGLNGGSTWIPSTPESSFGGGMSDRTHQFYNRDRDRDVEIQNSPIAENGGDPRAYEDASTEFSDSEDPTSPGVFGTGAARPSNRHGAYASTISSSTGGGHARLMVPSPVRGDSSGGRPAGPARTVTNASSRSGITTATSTAGFGGPVGAGTPPASFWKRLIPTSNVQRAFLVVVLIETAFDVGIMADLLYRYNLLVDDDSGSNSSGTITTSTLPVYLVIFLLAHLFQLCVAVYSTISRNTIQLVGLLIFNALFLAYAVLQTSEIREAFNIQLDDASTRENGIPPGSIFRVPISVLTYLIIGMIALAQACYIPLTYLLYKEFGWDVYHDFGASLAIRRYHFHQQIYSCLLLFTCFFFSGFSIQLIFLSLDRSSPEFYVTCVLWPISMLILALGLWAAWKENRPAMAAFIVGMLAAAGYFIFKTTRVWKERTQAEFATDYKSLTVFSSLSLAILALTTVAGSIIMTHFGKGLRERRLKRKERRRQRRAAAASASEKDGRADGDFEQTGHELDSKSPHRMSID